MNKNGLWSEVGYAIKFGSQIFLNIFGSLLLGIVWIALMLFPVAFEMWWLLWVTVPGCFYLLFVFAAFMAGREQD